MTKEELLNAFDQLSTDDMQRYLEMTAPSASESFEEKEPSPEDLAIRKVIDILSGRTAKLPAELKDKSNLYKPEESALFMDMWGGGKSLPDLSYHIHSAQLNAKEPFVIISEGKSIEGQKIFIKFDEKYNYWTIRKVEKISLNK